MICSITLMSYCLVEVLPDPYVKLAIEQSVFTTSTYTEIDMNIQVYTFLFESFGELTWRAFDLKDSRTLRS